MYSPGYPIDAVVTSSAAARELDAYGSDKHKIHLGECQPIEYSVPDGETPDEQQQETLSIDRPIKFRNRFDEEIPVGAQITLVMGADGIGHVVVWVCD